MSTTPDFDDDEYVAKLLAEDARKSSVKYATVGMSALVPKRPTGAAPKPNTRFLKALVRDVDTHNTALKQKEELEARSRLRNIRRDETSHESRREREHRHRSTGHRHDLDRGNDRKRRHVSDEDEHHRRTRHERSERHSTSRRSRSPDHKSKSHHNRDRRHKDESRREDDNSAGETKHASRGHRHRSARVSSDRAISDRDVPDEKPGRGHMNPSRSNSASSTSSDPLSSIIGPKPADTQISRKGRGFKRTPHSSTIDTRFSSSYNPSLDVDPDPNFSDDAADWDNALEALRDRRAWRVKQADRMREAGFGDDEIKRWEATSTRTRLGDDEGDVKDVKWRKKGEQREWDAGKVSEGANSDEASDEFDNTPGRLGGSKKQARANGGGVSTSSKAAGAKKSVNEAWKRPDNALLKQFRNALG